MHSALRTLPSTARNSLEYPEIAGNVWLKYSTIFVCRRLLLVVDDSCGWHCQLAISLLLLPSIPLPLLSWLSCRPFRLTSQYGFSCHHSVLDEYDCERLSRAMGIHSS
jgi:hypothetical protein